MSNEDCYAFPFENVFHPSLLLASQRRFGEGAGYTGG